MPASPVARQTPTGIRMDDGLPTKITINAVPTISFWEKTVKPPGIDGGEPYDVSNMFNTVWRSMNPRQLKTLTPMTIVAGWDPICYTSILAQINVKQAFTVTFYDGTTYAFYGVLNKFEPGEHQEGAEPTCTITITPTNTDPVTHAESAPVLANVAGT